MYVSQIPMDNFEQRIVMKFLFLQGKGYKAIHTEVHGVLGQEAVSLSTAKRWCQRFKQGQFDLNDEIRPGRPALDIADTISQLLKDEPFLSARVLAKRLGTNPHTIRDVLTRDLGLTRFTRRWVPHELSRANKARRVEDSRLLLEELRKDSRRDFDHIMTGDESWFYYSYDSSSMFARDRASVVPRVSKTIGSKKAMITIFFTGRRLLRLVYLPQGQKYNKEYFVSEILQGIGDACNHGHGNRGTKSMKIHMDNCRVHNAADTTAILCRLKLTRLTHPPYSPDLSPCDFWFFGRAKTAFRDQSFADADELLEALTNLFDSITFEELQSVFKNWIKRLEWVIAHGGEYFPE
jgi:histone-lysine N-methyltransferase SETMAR